MAFSKEFKKEIEEYCNNHLATDSWYENEFSFIKNEELKNRYKSKKWMINRMQEYIIVC